LRRKQFSGQMTTPFQLRLLLVLAGLTAALAFR
jgi:hypothetical protein